MAPLSRELALTDEELDDVMLSTWNMRIATVGPGTRINLTPLWFLWVNREIYFYGRGQKVVNIRRNPECTILVDRNERFPELQGAMFQGRATVLEDAAAEEADPGLPAARDQWSTKYAGGHGDAPSAVDSNVSTARGRTWRWVRFTPERLVSWDNFKLRSH